ncbi:MAG: C-GCAxxG-C-C family protein [Desulfitobacteriaceae bacterium]
MNNSNKAILMFYKTGFVCSQAVFATLGEQLGMERKQALRIAAGFGGGIANQGDICGAVSGAIMAIGLKHGHDEGSDVDAKNRTTFLAQQLIERIKAKYGYYTCRGITGIDFTIPEGRKLAEEQGIWEKNGLCQNVIKDTVELVEEMW